MKLIAFRQVQGGYFVTLELNLVLWLRPIQGYRRRIPKVTLRVTKFPQAVGLQ